MANHDPSVIPPTPTDDTPEMPSWTKWLWIGLVVILVVGSYFLYRFIFPPDQAHIAYSGASGGNYDAELFFEPCVNENTLPARRLSFPNELNTVNVIIHLPISAGEGTYEFSRDGLTYPSISFGLRTRQTPYDEVTGGSITFEKFPQKSCDTLQGSFIAEFVGGINVEGEFRVSVDNADLSCG